MKPKTHGYEDKLTYSVAVPNGQQRFRELIVYIAKKSEGDDRFGSTKLNKLLHKIDFTSFLRTGIPMTGTRYHCNHNGPTPVAFMPVQRELKAEGAVEEIEKTIRGYAGKPQRRLAARRDPDMSYFSPSEVEMIDKIIMESWGKDGTQMSDESHGVAWKSRKKGDSLPYETAYLSDEPLSQSDIHLTKQLIKLCGLPSAA